MTVGRHRDGGGDWGGSGTRASVLRVKGFEFLRQRAVASNVGGLSVTSGQKHGGMRGEAGVNARGNRQGRFWMKVDCWSGRCVMSRRESSGDGMRSVCVA